MLEYYLMNIMIKKTILFLLIISLTLFSTSVEGKVINRFIVLTTIEEDNKNSIYLIDLEKDKNINISKDLGNCHHAKLAFDNSIIAFNCGSFLDSYISFYDKPKNYIYKRDLYIKELSTGKNLFFSKNKLIHSFINNKYVIFEDLKNNILYSYEIKTKKVKKLTNYNSLEQFSLIDSSFLYKAKDKNGNYQIFKSSIENFPKANKLTNNKLNYLRASWSPNGEKIIIIGNDKNKCYNKNAKSYIFSIEKNKLKFLTTINDLECIYYFIDFKWLSDNKKIIFSDNTRNKFILDVESNLLHSYKRIEDIKFSPNNKKISYLKYIKEWKPFISNINGENEMSLLDFIDSKDLLKKYSSYTSQWISDNLFLLETDRYLYKIDVNTKKLLKKYDFKSYSVVSVINENSFFASYYNKDNLKKDIFLIDDTNNSNKNLTEKIPNKGFLDIIFSNNN